jgi:V8-like Glu-specific endopeptidase
MFNRFSIALLTGMFVPYMAYAFPLPTGKRAHVQKPPTMSGNYDFEGIVALSNCSGSIIQFEGAADTDHAVIMTNGHCYEDGMPDPGQVIQNEPSSRTFSVLNSGGSSLGRVHATEVIYSTMTKTDVTLYRLQETYADIRSQYNVRPFTLASQHPAIGTSINVISGYWKQGYSCQVEFFVHELDEAGYHMFDSIRYSRPGCEVIGGTSGSPIIAAGTRNVIGINNTGNEDGEKCTMNNPCEIDEQGNVTAVLGYSYGQETYLIYSCLNAQHELDLNKQGCMLAH